MLALPVVRAVCLYGTLTSQGSLALIKKILFICSLSLIMVLENSVLSTVAFVSCVWFVCGRDEILVAANHYVAVGQEGQQPRWLCP